MLIVTLNSSLRYPVHKIAFAIIKISGLLLINSQVKDYLLHVTFIQSLKYQLVSLVFEKKLLHKMGEISGNKSTFTLFYSECISSALQ